MPGIKHVYSDREVHTRDGHEVRAHVYCAPSVVTQWSLMESVNEITMLTESVSFYK